MVRKTALIISTTVICAALSASFPDPLVADNSSTLLDPRWTLTVQEYRESHENFNRCASETPICQEVRFRFIDKLSYIHSYVSRYVSMQTAKRRSGDYLVYGPCIPDDSPFFGERRELFVWAVVEERLDFSAALYGSKVGSLDVRQLYYDGLLSMYPCR
jgi:hypothetical protein